MATDLEAKPFLKGLSLHKAEKNPFPIFINNDFLLIISGIGKSNAAIATSYSILKYKTDYMFNIGAAGSTKMDIGIGEIFHIDRVIEYDRPRLKDKSQRLIKPDILKGFKTTSLSTQDRPIIDLSEREKVSKFANLVDMEGASVIQACRIFNVICYLFKIISDTPQHNNSIDIASNIKMVRDGMFNFFIEKIQNNLPRKR